MFILYRQHSTLTVWSVSGGVMTSAVKSKKDVVAEFRTSEILEAARKVFAERGFHEATVEEIAEAARVAKGTVYLYYASKRDVYFAALKFGIAQMYSSLLREVKKVSAPEQKLKSLI